MKNTDAGPVLQLLFRFAEILQDLVVKKLHLAHRTHRRHEPGNVIDDLTPREFPDPQRFLSLLVGAFASFSHGGNCSAACKENNSRQNGTQEWPNPKISNSAERPMGTGWVMRSQVALPRCAPEESIRAHREGIEPIQPHCLRS